MGKFCSNCGKELNENQDICLGCGVMVNKPNPETTTVQKPKHSGYYKVSSVIMIILGALFVLGANQSFPDSAGLIIIAGILSIIGAILTLNGSKNKDYIMYGGILYFIAVVLNFLCIYDISIFMILAIIFGILNIVYSREKAK